MSRSGPPARRALVLVDLQNDFLPGGALAVPRGDEVIPVANRLQRAFDLVVATKDWHPPSHCSFAVNHPGREVGEVIAVDGREQALWPVHCVQGSAGAELAPGLDRGRIAETFPKGSDPGVDSYSGFFDNAADRSRDVSTGLDRYLRGRGVGEVYLMGLATDYCVKHTALDAATLGFRTVLVADGCRAVDVHRGDGERAIEEMRRAGVEVTTAREAERRLATAAAVC